VARSSNVTFASISRISIKGMDAFRDVYERHYLAVYRLSLFLTGDPARAEDLAADTFVRAWTARDRIRHHTVRAYLLTIARNLYRDHLRAGRPLLVNLDEGIADESPGADARVEHASNLQSIRTRLRCIPPGDRRALLLYVVREMSHAKPRHVGRADISSRYSGTRPRSRVRREP